MASLKLERIELTNFRAFDHLTVDFDERLTVLVAENGQGKTSVLDAIAVMLGPYVAQFEEGQDRKFKRWDIKRLKFEFGKSYNPDLHFHDALNVVCSGIVKGIIAIEQKINWSRQLARPASSRTTTKNAIELVVFGKGLSKSLGRSNITAPVIAYYGTKRTWSGGKINVVKKLSETPSIGYKNCLDPSTDYKDFELWFAKTKLRVLEEEQNRSHSEISINKKLITSVRNAVDICLLPTGWRDINYDFNELEAFNREHGWLPLTSLSDGIRNTIALVADIAFRATKLNPHLGAEASQKTPGIVLIDEVDMHLHPKWQQTILPSLLEAFPLMQFIVTTHSPQVLTTVRKENIRVISQDTETGKWTAEAPDESPLGRKSADALSLVMRTDPKPVLQPLDGYLSKYEHLAREGQMETPEAVALRKKIEDEGYEIPEADLEMWKYLASRMQKKNG